MPAPGSKYLERLHLREARMPSIIWSGAISFGLVTSRLVPAE
ncbi:hypothetical protein [Streptomyces sp. NPDC056061]